MVAVEAAEDELVVVEEVAEAVAEAVEVVAEVAVERDIKLHGLAVLSFVAGDSARRSTFE